MDAGLLPLFVFLGLLLWAAACDVATMEIPNRISVLLAGLYPVLALAFGAAPAAIGVHLAFGAAALAAAYVLFQLNVFGGGDAKVLAAAAVWTGPEAFAPFVLAVAVAGGVLAGGLLLARRLMRPREDRPAFLNRLLDPSVGAPYAVAIAAGGALASGALSL